MLDKLVDELVIKQKKKILIFSGFTTMLDLCEDLLVLKGGDGSAFKYSRLDGGSARARRNLDIRLFNNLDSDYKVMLISTRAGGLGINLASASDVILMDQDWNPQITLQAEARAHRIGQTNPVTVYKICTQGTVEEQMMGRIQKKLYLSAKVTEAMEDRRGTPRGLAKEEEPQLNTSQLMALVRRGAQTLAHPQIDVNDMLSWDWETTLEKCANKPADHSINGADVSHSEEQEKAWLSQIEQVETRVFEGKQFSKAKDTHVSYDIMTNAPRQDRRIGKNVTVMMDGFAINKESLHCQDWEAVPTMAAGDRVKFQDAPRRKKALVVNQSVSPFSPFPYQILTLA